MANQTQHYENTNIVVLRGRATKDTEVRYSQGEDSKCIARFTLAVNDRGEATNFIPCVAFNKQGEFAERFVRKGTDLLVTGRIKTGNYTNKDGQKVYTTEVVVDRMEFVGGKRDDAQSSAPTSQQPQANNGFIDAQMNLDDEELPF